VSDAGRSRPNNSRVMRTNFGGTTAEIFREHSDSLDKELPKQSRQGEKFSDLVAENKDATFALEGLLEEKILGKKRKCSLLENIDVVSSLKFC
jgi:hypothetical protein